MATIKLQGQNSANVVFDHEIDHELSQIEFDHEIGFDNNLIKKLNVVRDIGLIEPRKFP